MQGCPRLGRPARTSPNIAEMKEEQHDRVGKVKEKRNEKVNTIKIDSIVIYIPQSVVALYIYRVGRSCPARKSFYKANLSGLLRLGIGGTGQTGNEHRSDRCTRCADLAEGVSPHPDSDLDVPHMNLDLLDETYSMVKSKLYFVYIDHTGLTGGTHRSDRSNQTCQFWVRTDSMKILCDSRELQIVKEKFREKAS
jgi:hypothetical protein